jgi:hypothetical protein
MIAVEVSVSKGSVRRVEAVFGHCYETDVCQAQNLIKNNKKIFYVEFIMTSQAIV